MKEADDIRWLLLIHQIPPKPSYLRVKIWRRLQRLGAVAIKNSVYVLPKSDQSREDFQWVLREIVEGGGDGTLCEARLVDGINDDEVEGLFQVSRTADYDQIAEDARRLTKTVPPQGKLGKKNRPQLELDLARLKRHLDEAVAIDFFGAPGREAATGLLSGIEARLRDNKAGPTSEGKTNINDLRGKTWVTRTGIHVDRMATAWVVRRFIDPEARIKFVPAKGYTPLHDEIRFDMFEAEFTHENDCCSMEVLMMRTGIRDPGLVRIAEIVHDIDLKDSKFEREETTGIARLIDGIAMAHRDDDARLARATAIFDDLYENFRRKLRP
ncbi:MAG TPA: chromate resistance protein ChrB domain-containing protein [Candidatus Limnocylindria bacterium]|nr:chromate resistance protein ChrB domain-containing protein [Candidatus Limnocylindria bacterium]